MIRQSTFFTMVFIMAIGLTGCLSFTNKTPDPVESSEPSYDGNIKDSGVLALARNGNGFIVTKGFAEHYNFLISKYKESVNPNLKKNDGLRDYKCYTIDKEHFVYYLQMNELNKSNIKQ